MKTQKMRALALSAAVAAALALAACGDDDSTTTEATTTSDAAEASAGTTTLAGEFELVKDAPDGYEDAAGEATLTVSEEGTTATLEVTGLDPDTEYISHVHAGSCEQPDPGGPHFQFELGGPEEPPNEIHLPFTTDADGAGSAEAENDQPIPEGAANAIVIHLPEDHEHGSEMEDDSMGDGHDDDHDDHADSHDEDEKAEDGHSHTHSDKLLCATLG